MNLLTIPMATQKLGNYAEWWDKIDRKTRNMIRKSKKKGVQVKQVKPDEAFWLGVCSIFNESPDRRGRPYPHYGKTLDQTKEVFRNYIDNNKNIYFGAFYGNKLIGFSHLLKRSDNKGWAISAIQSYETYFSLAPMNALINSIVQFCCENGIKRLTYGRMQNDGLGQFKKNNGFVEKRIPRIFGRLD